MSLTSRHPLRKSCSFCRARKIKCSNETICEACRKQNVDCVYDWDSRPPKGRTVSADNTRTSDAGLRLGEFGSITPQRQRSSTGGSPKSSPTIMEEPMSMDGQVVVGENVANALVEMWNQNFSDSLPPNQKLNPWQERISAYHRTLTSNMQDRSETVASKFTSKNVKYTGISTLLSHDLVGLVCDKFGSLSTTFMESGGGRLFLTGLINDHTQSMFDSTPPGPSPLTEYGNRQITQMVDVWFSIHPLCFLVSKTLLLRELRDGTHDEILLAVILADASFSIGDDVAMARGQVLIRWAAAQLRNRIMTSPRTNPGGMAGAGMSLPGISTAQVLMLLGWNALCQGQMRRATCYVGLSGRMAQEIKDQISSSPAPMTTSRINGIDVFEVEKEVIAYLYWTTYTMTLFVFMQMGNHFSQLLPTSLTSIFLPVDETSSVLIRLDEVSDNFSTLQKQKAMIKEMWPLAHIASITAYIYNLYPQEPETTEVNTNFWQEAPLLALQRIQQGSSPQDMACVCREVYRVLMESIHLLNRQVAHAPSRSLVLVVYHTMAIHLLFPATLPGALPTMEPLTPEIIERYISSAQELVNLYHQVADASEEPVGVMPQSRNCFPDIFCLALDTCARAMNYILGQKKAGALMIEAPVLQLYDTRLEALASRLHIIAQSDFLNIGASSTLRVVKKHLKSVMRAFGSASGRSLSHSHASTSSGSSPENSRRNSSLPHTPPITIMPAPESDRLSTATTTVDHSSSSFVSPMDTTMLPSSDCGPVDTIPTSDIPTPFNPFSPEHDGSNAGKPDWRAADDLFHHVMDPSALGTPTSGPPEHLNLADLVDIQNGWFPGNQMLMDFDMTAAHLPDQWQWPTPDMGHDAGHAAAAAGGDLDAMFYFRSDRK